MSRSHILDIYGTDLRLLTSRREWKHLAREFPALKPWTPDADTAGQVAAHAHQPKRGLPQLVIAIYIDRKRHGDDTYALVDTCAHEASHAAGRILEHAGHVVDGTDEPHAYLCGWLTRFIYEGCTS